MTAKANQGIAEAELLLGLKYADGESVEANDAEAAKWLGRAAQKGKLSPSTGWARSTRRASAYPLDMKIAADWYAKAAETRQRESHAQSRRRLCQRERPRHELHARPRAGSVSAAQRGLADSQFNLAVLHERGLGVRTSLTEAYRWYVDRRRPRG